MPEKTLGAMLLAVLTKELPGLEELALVKILHQRMELDSPDLDLIKQGVAQECFSDDEQKEAEDFATKHHKTKEASLTVQAEMAKLHKAIAQKRVLPQRSLVQRPRRPRQAQGPHRGPLLAQTLAWKR